MFDLRDAELSYENRINENERIALDKFLNLYERQDEIIADSHEQFFGVLPLKDKNAVFRTNSETDEEKMFFRRKVSIRNNIPYVVSLYLRRKCDPRFKLFTDDEIRIITPNRIHLINSCNDDLRRYGLTYRLNNLFRQDNIISPEQAYCSRMTTSPWLQTVIENHDWAKINELIKINIDLARKLFIISEKTDYISSSAEFGSILYQLVDFRQKYGKTLEDNDLMELDKVIQKLNKIKYKDNPGLIKVGLSSGIVNTSSVDTSLLGPENSRISVHGSYLHSIMNLRLDEEAKVLKKRNKRSI